jgi:hypothetical protein
MLKKTLPNIFELYLNYLFNICFFVSLRAGASAEALPEKSRKRLRKISKNFFQNFFCFSQHFWLAPPREPCAKISRPFLT